VLATPVAAGLSKAQKNDASAFLPGRAESTRLIEQQRHLPGGDTVPTIIAYARRSGLTAADKAAVDRARTALTPLAAGGAAPLLIPSRDGRVRRVGTSPPRSTCSPASSRPCCSSPPASWR
jgi:RND superfamily putative drug exporter